MELVPVRRFPRPSRSIHFGDVSGANGRETHFRLDHVTRNALPGQDNEALGLGKSFFTYADAYSMHVSAPQRREEKTTP